MNENITIVLFQTVDNGVQKLHSCELFDNPTGLGIRDDTAGSGEYEASRGDRSHSGLEILNNPGQFKISPFSGRTVATESGGVNISATTETGAALSVTYVYTTNTNRDLPALRGKKKLPQPIQ